MITVMKHSETEKLNKFYEQIAKDSKESLIQLLSKAGHGKTSSLRTIIHYIKQTNENMEFVIFDVSQAWWHCAPVQYRQLVTREKWNCGQIVNLTDCVYEMGKLTQDERRVFVGEIVSRHYHKRYQAKLDGTLKEMPFLIFIFEEANTYFGSRTMTKNDAFTPIFVDFVSVGRNYKMRGFLVATAEEGEIHPLLRRRSSRIYGRLESDGDISRIRRKDKELASYLKEAPKYNFVYYNGKQFGPVKIPDVVTNIPIDYIVTTPIVQPKSGNEGWWIKFLGTIAIFLLFWSWLMGI